MRRVQAKKIRKAAFAVAQLSGSNPKRQYKLLKKVHKNLSHNEKK